jgi:hypothetical protein
MITDLSYVLAVLAVIFMLFSAFGVGGKIKWDSLAWACVLIIVLLIKKL